MLARIGAILIGFVISWHAAAHGGHDHGRNEANKAVLYRQSVFNMIGWHFKVMGKMVQGRADYDANDFHRRAQLIAELSSMLAEGFTAQSQTADIDTALTPEMWYQKKRFDGLLEALQQSTAALAAQPIEENKNVLRKPLGRVARDCKQCHDRFRVQF